VEPSASLAPFLNPNDHKRMTQQINVWNSRDGSLAANMPDNFAQAWTL